VESEVAKAISDQLRAKLTGQEQQVIAVKPTDNVEAYDAYLRGLAYSVKPLNTANCLAAQKYLREAVRLDPKFAVAWALLSVEEALGYVTAFLQPTDALREDAQHVSFCPIAARFLSRWPMSSAGEASGTGASGISTKPSDSILATLICSGNMRCHIAFFVVSPKRCESLIRFSTSHQTTCTYSA
jgi:hypothetical protein